MNRAAEEAAGEAREILRAEVRTLTFPEAVAILNGGPTAATDLLNERTSAEIREDLEPIVVRKMEEVGLPRLKRGDGWPLQSLILRFPTGGRLVALRHR